MATHDTQENQNRKKKSKSKKNKAPLGILFWIAFILLILVFFFAQKDVIIPLFQKFSTEVSSSESKPVAAVPIIPAVSENADKKTDGADGSLGHFGETVFSRNEEPKQKDDLQNDTKTSDSKDETKVDASKANTKTLTDKKNQPEKTDVSKSPAQTVAQDSEKKSDAPVQPEMRTLQVYFVRIDDFGTIIREKVSRKVPKDNSPLTASIKELLGGTYKSETSQGLISLVPAETRLLSASVKDGTAILNFSDAFEFNTHGIDGFRGQLMQIVFTATEFPTVQNVQFLIEGQRKEYLGTEGIRLGVPFSRNSF